MKITIAGPNLPHGFDKGTFVAHVAGCADLEKLRRRLRGNDMYFDDVEVATRLEAAEWVYPRGEFEWDWEDMYIDDIWFAPCLAALPRREER